MILKECAENCKKLVRKYEIVQVEPYKHFTIRA
jgi:hypothetical protein